MYEDTYLAHYGVKGMKWGVRKNPTDVTSYSKRKIKKKIDKANKTPEKNVNTIKVQNRLESELLNKTKEGKAMKNASDVLIKMQKEANRRNGGKQATVLVDKDFADWYNGVQESYIKKGKELITKKYRDDMASAMLKDLSYDDTKAGREYLKKLGFI
jgi:phage terminase small subunit